MDSRLLAFRDEAYARGFGQPSSPKEEHWTRAFFERYADLPLAERQARSLAYALTNEPVYIHDHTRIAGQMYQRCPGSAGIEAHGSGLDPRWQDFAALPVAARMVQDQFPEHAPYGKYFNNGVGLGHICWDFGRLLELGSNGIIQMAREASDRTNDPEAREFYAGVEIVHRGLVEWVERHVSKLTEMIRAAEPERAAELREMADVCARVPAGPATTFRDAVQSFFFQHLAVMYENPQGGNGPGRLDYYLWPYLQAELDAGRTTLDEARDLVVELFIKLHERIADGDGWVEAIVAGGRNPDGSSGVNPLSHIIVDVITELRQTHPSVYVRLDNDAPDDFVDLTVRYLIEGENRAQVYGDDNMIAALHADGVAIEDARHWCAGGCMEVSPQGCSGDMLFTFAHNVPRTLELIMNGGKLLNGDGEQAIPHEKTLADYGSFDELWADFETELERELRLLLRRLDMYLGCLATYRPSFLLSSMTHDCMERGRAIMDGGARYQDYGGSGVGIPNVGDSLYALKRALFEDRAFTGRQVLDALRDDFAGHEHVHAYLRKLPKFGSGDPEAVEMVDRVLRTFCRIIKSHRNPFGGHCRPIILGFVWVVSHGQQVGATPDGRKAGRPLAQSLSPQSGAAVDGITAAINDATSLSLLEAGGGGSMMWDIASDWAKPEFVKPLLLTFIEQGGHIFQGNATSVDDLIEAQKRPDEHRDLMVRVGGYSARFVTLSEATQQEIIERHRYRG